MRLSSACFNCSPPHDTTDLVTAIDVLQDYAAGGQHRFHPLFPQKCTLNRPPG